jgi:hypothetical protein
MAPGVRGIRDVYADKVFLGFPVSFFRFNKEGVQDVVRPGENTV